MALTNSQHDAIMRIYDAIRTENRHIQNERYAQVTAACPEIAQIEDDIIGLSMQAAAEMLKNPDVFANFNLWYNRTIWLFNRNQLINTAKYRRTLSSNHSFPNPEHINLCVLCH